MSKKGPFGLWMGMSLADVESEAIEVAPAKYRLLTVPKPHSAFESYILQITPANGLAWIKAIGHNIQTSVYGLELKTAFEVMEKKLSVNYGSGNKTDILLQDSIWNEPRDWMQSLLNRERFMMAEWSMAQGSSLPQGLSSVALITVANDTESGYIAVEYSFENSEAAEAEIAAAEGTLSR
jgi:hypothetical protein